MIGGFIIQGTQPKRVILRAIGPELSQYGVPNVLPDPTLELHDGTGALIAPNDNWQHTIIGGISPATKYARSGAAVTLQATQASRRLLQTCRQVTTPGLCAAKTLSLESLWWKYTISIYELSSFRTRPSELIYLDFWIQQQIGN